MSFSKIKFKFLLKLTFDIIFANISYILLSYSTIFHEDMNSGSANVSLVQIVI